MKIALVENFGSDFYGARLRYALFLKERGHDIVAVIPNDGFVDKIEKEGIRVVPIDIDIRTRKLGIMIRYALKLREIFKMEKFDVIHLYRMQPNLIGSPMAYFASKKSVLINHVTGLGVAFTKKSVKYSLIKSIIKNAYYINHSWFNAKLIFQNVEDKIELGNKKEFSVVKGSAVNEDKFRSEVKVDDDFCDEINQKYGVKPRKTLIFVSRLLKQKGLGYLVEAVREYNYINKVNTINLLVGGWIDSKNPDSYTEEDIRNYSLVEGIYFLGKRDDVDKLISFSDIAVLPTYYREGTPRFLLEAMAMGKPIITTDMPGCNHLVKDNINGILVDIKSKDDLVSAITSLLKSDLGKMGLASRKIYENDFSENVIYNQLLKIYTS